ncbi:MAG: cyclic pyranopterin monophosphate synthase MoaC [Desulfurococcaceae archaeon]
MRIQMADITSKDESFRVATATGFIKLRPETIERIKNNLVEKGDVLTISSIAAIIGVKNTSLLLPLTHNIPITNVDVKYEIAENGIRVFVTVKSTAKTGVEMEALMGVATALLNIWDMVKKYEKDEKGQYPDTAITEIKVLEKIKAEIQR